MKQQIFRQKSIDRISSPEQLNDYIRVSNPSVWMIMGAILCLLVGICIWGIFGSLDTTLKVVAVSKESRIICYVKENNIDSVKKDMSVKINGETYQVSEIAEVPVEATDAFDSYVLHVGSIQNGEWIYEIVLDGNLADGIYEADIITESMSPMSFLLN